VGHVYGFMLFLMGLGWVCFDSLGRRKRGPYAGRRERGPYAGRRERGPYAGRRERGPYAGRRERGPYAGRRERGPYHRSFAMAWETLSLLL
jgi:hypothetical protein